MTKRKANTLTSSSSSQSIWIDRLRQLFTAHPACNNTIASIERWMLPASDNTMDGRDLHLFPNTFERYNLKTLDGTDSTHLFSHDLLSTSRLSQSVETHEVTGFCWSIDAKTQEFREQRLHKQKEIQTRWKTALDHCDDDSFWNINTFMKHSLFLPNISAPSCKSQVVQKRMQNLALTIEQQFKKTANNKRVKTTIQCEQDRVLHWAKELPWPISGFGTEAVQFYAKTGLTVTMLHDELGWSSALNYMTRASNGVALWIGVNMNELAAHFSKTQLKDMLNQEQVPQLLSEFYRLRASLPSLKYAWQHPGDLISSPQEQGSCHFVVTVGSFCEQIAWNVASTVSGTAKCIDFWGKVEAVQYNSGLATLNVVPAAVIQFQHPEWYLGSQTRQIVQQVERVRTKAQIQSSIAKNSEFCDDCQKQCFFIKDSTTGQCERCVK